MVFEIKYEIFEDDINELRNINLQSIMSEFNQIYGCFTLLINGKEFIPYPPPEMRLNTKRIFSELILTHFDLLIDVYFELKKQNYVVLKYIENPWTWLEFIRNGSEITVSKLNISISARQPIQTNRDLFIRATKEKIINECILWEQFKNELFDKSKTLLIELEAINRNILKAPRFQQVIDFTNYP